MTEKSTHDAAEQFQRKHAFLANPPLIDGHYGPRTAFEQSLVIAANSLYPIHELMALARQEFNRRMELEALVEEPTDDGVEIDDMLMHAKALVEERLELKAVLRAIQDNLAGPGDLRRAPGQAYESLTSHPVWLAARTKLAEVNNALNNLGMGN